MFALLMVCACGQVEPPPLNFAALRKGQVGTVRALGGDRKSGVDVRVAQVLDAQTAVCRVVSYRPKAEVVGATVVVRPVKSHTCRVVLRGIATDNLVDGKAVHLPGAWKVARTRRLSTVDGAAVTLWQLEPVEPPKPKPEPARR